MGKTGSPLRSPALSPAPGRTSERGGVRSPVLGRGHRVRAARRTRAVAAVPLRLLGASGYAGADLVLLTMLKGRMSIGSSTAAHDTRIPPLRPSPTQPRQSLFHGRRPSCGVGYARRAGPENDISPGHWRTLLYLQSFPPWCILIFVATGSQLGLLTFSCMSHSNSLSAARHVGDPWFGIRSDQKCEQAV